MRILAGELKARNITVPLGIRPVSLRVKKSCFDVLADEIRAKSVLDLFSGSGSLGIEALSRGAKKVVFMDSNQSCILAIKENIHGLRIADRAQVYFRESLAGIKKFAANNVIFDLIFLDPPYYKGLLIKTLQALEEYDILATSGYLVAFCYSKDKYLTKSNKFEIIFQRKYGQTVLLIYKLVSYKE